MDCLKVGIIGIGNMGSTHAASIAAGKIRGMKLCSVCDTDENKLNVFDTLPNIAKFSDYRSLIDSGIANSIIIATPHYFHPGIAIYALQRGLNVLTEKPAGVRLSDVIRMNEAAKKSTGVFGIMWNQRTNPLFLEAKKIIDDGLLGIPKRLVWLITNWYRTESYYNSASWRATWSGEGGGVLINQAPHNIDIWQWLFGMPKYIRAECFEGKYHDIEVEDDAVIFAEYENGATAQFITSTGEYPGTNRLEITGDRGRILLEGGKLYFTRLFEDERSYCRSAEEGAVPIKTSTFDFSFGDTGSGHNAILQNFAEAVLDGKPLIAPGTDGINEITITNAAYLSSWTGRKIEIPFDYSEFDSLLSDKIAHSRKKNVTASKSAVDHSERWQVNW